jgi:hypothetical protein
LLSTFFGVLGALALILEWTAGKAHFFFLSCGLTGMAVVHLITLGILGELVVGTSDLAHTQLPEITKKTVFFDDEEEKDQETPQHVTSASNPSNRTHRTLIVSKKRNPKP